MTDPGASQPAHVAPALDFTEPTEPILGFDSRNCTWIPHMKRPLVGTGARPLLWTTCLLQQCNFMAGPQSPETTRFHENLISSTREDCGRVPKLTEHPGRFPNG